MFEEIDKHEIAVFGGYLRDEIKILKSASGGAATALAEHVISRGGLVVGVAYKSDYSGAEYVIVDDLVGINKLRGTKVIEVEKNNIFQNVKNALENNKTVLFFGLPCVVKSLIKYLKNDYINLITCELICSGQTYKKVHTEYCEWLEKKYKSKIVDFTVRYKRDAWLPEYMHVVFENGKVYEKPFKKTEYGIAFKVLKREGCCHCTIRGNTRSGDLMIGDFWGVSEADSFWNPKGVSVILVHTEKGLNLLQGLDNMYMAETSFTHAVSNNLSVINKIKVFPERENLIPIFQDRGLFAAMKKSETFKRVRKSNFIDAIPTPIHSLYRKIKCVINIVVTRR